MRFIWVLFMLFSIISALRHNLTAELSAAVLNGASAGIQLAITLAGPLCLWSGAANVMQHSGLQKTLTAACAPVLKRLFPSAWCDPAARDAICGNLTANLLGLGNAATPFGIQAARAMAAHTKGYANDELCRLVVMNTASIQLLPVTVAAVRSGLGSNAPFDLLPAVWITSLCSVTAGLLTAKGLSRWATHS